MAKLNRTLSSPSLRANTPGRTQWPRSHYNNSRQVERESHRNKYGYFHDGEEDEDEEFYVIGDRVFVDGHKAASVAYFGEVEFAPGDWVGVVMDNPLGNHNGKVHGREYFQCAPFHGLFVKPHRVARMPDSLALSSGGLSRTSTPLPTLHQRPYLTEPTSAVDVQRNYGHISSPTASSVTTDSYFYDDDYRQGTRLPTIASLGQRINEIEASSSRPQSRASSTTTPIGILKRSPHRHSLEPRSRSETRQSSCSDNRATIEQYNPKEPVFNFRPRRAQLDPAIQRDDSAGILSDVSNRTSSMGIVDLSSEPPQVGDRIWVRSERGDLAGILRFMGETNFATGEWAGVELDQAEGKNDGSVLGYRYFYCPQRYGLFVPATRIRKSHDVSPGFKAMRSTIKSPPPPQPLKTTITNYDRNHYNSSSNGSRSVTPSSYYSEKTTPSPANDDFGRQYSSASSNTTPSYENKKSSMADEILNHFTRFFDNSYKLESPKFDDNDIEYQLKRSLQRNNHPRHQSSIAKGNFDDAKLGTKPRCVKYTFSSSKYDGNPIARRTVEYD